MKKIITILLLGIFVFCPLMVTGENEKAEQVVITQTNSNQDIINVFFDITDENDNSVNNISLDDIKVLCGQNTLPVNKVNQIEQSEHSVQYLFLVDISKSLNKDHEKNIKNILDKTINTIKEKDKVAIMTFGDSVNTALNFTNDKELIQETVQNIEIKDNNTNLYKAIIQAIDFIGKHDEEATKNVIIVISDGVESHDKGYTKDEVYRKIEENEIPIMTIGFYSDAMSKDKKESIKVLSSFARMTNGKDYLVEAGNENLEEIALSIGNAINKGYVAEVDCSSINADGSEQCLALTVLNEDNTQVVDEVNIRLAIAEITPTVELTPTIEVTPTEDTRKDDSEPTFPFMYIGIAVLVIIIVLVILIIAIKQRKKKIARQNAFEEDENIMEEGESMEDNHTIYEKMDSTGNIQSTIPLQSSQNNQQGIQIKLTKLARHEEEKVYTINLFNTAIIGRNNQICQLSIDDSRLSAKHCELMIKDDDVYINDLNSTNGTYVNGVIIDGYYKLVDDDILLIGSMELRVSIIR